LVTGIEEGRLLSPQSGRPPSRALRPLPAGATRYQLIKDSFLRYFLSKDSRPSTFRSSSYRCRRVGNTFQDWAKTITQITTSGAGGRGSTLHAVREKSLSKFAPRRLPSRAVLGSDVSWVRRFGSQRVLQLVKEHIDDEFFDIPLWAPTPRILGSHRTQWADSA